MAKEPLKFETEKDFQDYKKEIDDARKEVAAGIKEAHLNIKDGEKINVNIDFKGLAKALYDLQKTLKEGWEEFRIELINNKQEFDFLASAPQKVVNLEPFIDFTSAGLSIADFYHECYTDDWQPKKDSPYYVYITQARKRRAEYNKREKENKKFKALQLFADGKYNPIDKAVAPIDKVSISLIGLSENIEMGQMMIETLQGKNRKTHGVLLGVDFAALVDYCKRNKIAIPKEITEFDLFFIGLVFSLAWAGNEWISINKLCEVLGMSAAPTSYALISETIIKLSHTDLSINNLLEAQKSNFPIMQKETARLLPIRRKDIIINGKMAKNAIKLMEVPLIIEFAISRNQFVEFPLHILYDLPVSKTALNFSTVLYLFRQISHYRNGGRRSFNEINWQTLYDRNSIKDHKARYRNTVTKILEHFKQKEIITGYAISNKKITFSADKNKKIEAGEKYALP